MSCLLYSTACGRLAAPLQQGTERGPPNKRKILFLKYQKCFLNYLYFIFIFKKIDFKKLYKKLAKYYMFYKRKNSKRKVDMEKLMKSGEKRKR